MFFGPLSISYDVWMMFDFGLKKFFLRLKIGPKHDLKATFPLGFRCRNFWKIFWPKIASKDTSSTWCSRTKKLDRYMHSLGTQGVLKIFGQNPEKPTNEEKWWLCLVGAHTWGGVRAKQSTIPYLYTISILASNSTSKKKLCFLEIRCQKAVFLGAFL